MGKDISINVPILARVEGEGALELCIRDSKIETLKLKFMNPQDYLRNFWRVEVTMKCWIL